tara:strand:- start:13878 stop:14570 length:693 start_codon:yes stop_codon:yes gene_type:complete
MAALDYLHRAGLTVEAVAGKLRVSPVERITPELHQYLRDHKTEILIGLDAANEMQQPFDWLHLLVLIDGRVIQRTGDLATASVEKDASQHYGDDLLAVIAVTGFERPLIEGEIFKALAGTLAAPSASPAPSGVWLTRISRLLGAQADELLEDGHLEQHDLIELAGIDAIVVADAIRTSPAWINRRQRTKQPVEQNADDENDLYTVHTVFIASAGMQAGPRSIHQPLDGLP